MLAFSRQTVLVSYAFQNKKNKNVFILSNMQDNDVLGEETGGLVKFRSKYKL